MPRQSNAAYWAQRMKTMESALLDRSYGYVENLEKQFSKAQAEIDRKIARWYQRFADNNEIDLAEAKKRLTAGELEEFHWTVDEYIQYGRQNALDGAWMKELENASARVHISRLEALKLELQQEAEVLYGNQLDGVDQAVRQIYEDSYYHTAFEVQRGLGVGCSMQALNQSAIEKVLSRPWTADDQTFRDRCWTNKQHLVNAVNTQLTQMIIRGEAPDRTIAAIAKQFGVSKAKAGRLVMTESAYFASAAQRDCFASLDVERYRIVASFDHDTCALCGDLDGKVFKMSEYEVGLTAPPFHPWCVLPDSVVLSPDANAMTKSLYSGDVVQLVAANGRRLSITPNHIMLTARGWVRAKNLVEGDKIVYYSGWDKFIMESDPTQYDRVPTVEKLFAALLEFSAVPPVSVPATTEHLKGDVIKDSEISVIPINSLLRSKLDASGCKLFRDFSLVGATEAAESLFSQNCSMSQFLTGAGLAADGSMGGLHIADILLRGALTHHELVSLRRSTDYNARLCQSAHNYAAGDGEFSGKAVDTFAVHIAGDNSTNIKGHSGVRLSNSNPVFFEDAHDGLSGCSKDTSDFLNAFPGVVEFTDIIRVDRSFFTGHVYDISSLSTLYICNGFVSSNCRCCTCPYFEDMEGIGERWTRNGDGSTQKVPADMTFEDWKKGFVSQTSSPSNSHAPPTSIRDVTEEYLKKATPARGKITYEAGYKEGRHQEETKTAQWLHEHLGGDITLLNESDELGIKMPDYSWRGKLWELKTTSTLNATDSAVRKALKQIQDNPGGIILDYGDHDIDVEKLVQVISRRIERGSLKQVDVIMLVKNQLLKVLRHKK